MQSFLTFNLEDILLMLAEFAINTVVVWFIVHFLYFPKSRRRDYYFTFMLISVSVFFLIYLLGGVKIHIGFALGLFAIFGIIRYRTESMPVREMTYLFVIIALSVVNALASAPTLGEVFCMNLLFVGAIAAFERIKVKGSMATKLVQYDRIELIKPENRQQLISDLQNRTGLDVVCVEVGGIDFLRDMAVLKIYYRGNGLSTVGNLLKVNREEMCAMQRTCVLVALMGLFVTVGYAQQSDFGVWATVGADKKLSKQWSVAGELGLRTRDNSKEMDRYHLGLEADYKPWKFLKMTVGYNFLYDNRSEKVTYHKDGTENKITPAYWWPRHRFLLGVTGSYSLGNLDLSLREMYQYTYRPKASGKKYDTDTKEWEDVKSKSQHQLRSRFQMAYNIGKSPFKPFGSVEMYHGEGGLQKTRYTLGTDIALSKRHSLKVYYRYQDLRVNDDDDLDLHVLGIGYKYKF